MATTWSRCRCWVNRRPGEPKRAKSIIVDNYPENLKPRFDAGGGVEEPFEEWWPKVQRYFPNVPEDVAKYWLHEHWSRSCYAYLRSRDYQFDLVSWPSGKLFEVRSTFNGFAADNKKCVEHGRYLVDDWEFPVPYRTSAFMIEHGEFPTPIIILDNRDGHINSNTVQHAYENLPAAYVLIEGHRRFNIALYLQKTGRLKPQVYVWLMTKSPA
ncbi:hypothetical protein [Bradyrhizobium sp.]|uniref:hypothetical protein n=1 Tax=Bradyrhizobium sp. TaxID=376 RepID=UPI003C74675E